MSVLSDPPPTLVIAAFAVAAICLRLLLLLLLRCTRKAAVALSGRSWGHHPVARAIDTAGAALARRSPRIAAFLAARFVRARFDGLPLTTLVVVALAMVVMFSELTEEVLERHEILAFDNALLGALAPLRTPALVAGFAWLTRAGDETTLAVAVVVATGLLWAERRYPTMAGLWVTVIGSQAMLWIAKFAIDRTRPAFLTVATAASPSFPSGHATGAMAIYGFLAYAVARRLRRPGDRFEVGYWAGVFILLIAFSRLLLHVHYPSDVLGGLLTGGLWMALGVATAEWAARQPSS